MYEVMIYLNVLVKFRHKVATLAQAKEFARFTIERGAFEVERIEATGNWEERIHYVFYPPHRIDKVKILNIKPEDEDKRFNDASALPGVSE